MKAWYSDQQASISGTHIFTRDNNSEVEVTFVGEKPAYNDVKDLGEVAGWKRKGRPPMDANGLQGLIDAGTPLTPAQQALADRLKQKFGQLTQTDIRKKDLRDAVTAALKLNDLPKIKAALGMILNKIDS